MRLETKFALWSIVLLSSAWAALSAVPHRSLLPNLVALGSLSALATVVAHYGLFGPLRRLLATAKAMHAGDFSKRLSFTRRDELGRLALELDRLCDQLQAAQLASEAHIAALDQLRHADRIATLGRLASSVAHELGNPLNVIELRAELITSGAAATLEQARQNASIIVEQTRRMTRIVDQILSFARMQPARISRLELRGVIRKAIALCMHTSRKHRADILLVSSDAEIELDGDADKILQIIVNLVINGIQSMPDGGTLRLSVSDELRAAPDDPEGARQHYACVEVADRGIGIPSEHMSKVFEPFFSTKNSGGTGLGLSVAQDIAREHAGWITVTSELGRGSSFKVHLPVQHWNGGGAHAS